MPGQKHVYYWQIESCCDIIVYLKGGKTHTFTLCSFWTPAHIPSFSLQKNQLLSQKLLFVKIINPRFYCPDNCSGRGVCNNHHVTHVHSNTTNNAPLMFLRPTCECFDTSDSSPGCTHTSIIRAPLMDVESCGDVVIHDSNDLDDSNNSKSDDSSGFSRAGGGPWAKLGANYSKAWKVYRWIFGVCILPLYHDIFLSWIMRWTWIYNVYIPGVIIKEGVGGINVWLHFYMPLWCQGAISSLDTDFRT